MPLQKRGRSCTPLASPSPFPPVSLRYYQAATRTNESILKLDNSNSHVRSFSISTSADCSLNPSTSLQLTAAIKNPARTKSFHANLMQRRDQAPAPTAGGNLALTLRRSVRERCVGCHACYTSRVFCSYVSPSCGTPVCTGVESSQCPIGRDHAGSLASDQPLHVGAAHPLSYAIAKARP